jgi:hypothetical protein
VIPGPARPFFQAAAANFALHSQAAVDTANQNRGPLLLISGTKDHTVPDVTTRSTLQQYRHSTAVTELKQFENRGRSLTSGLHLGGAFFTPSIGPTVRALTELAPDLLVPGHCTGWRAQHTLAAALPGSWIQGSSGTRYQLTAGPARTTADRKPRTGRDQTDE